MIRVLQVGRGAIVGGFDYCREISRAFASGRFDVTNVFIRKSVAKERLGAYAGKVICLNAQQRRQYRYSWLVALKLLSLTRKGSFDLAICHHYTAAAAINAMLKFSPVGNVYMVVHDYDYFAKTTPSGRRYNHFITHQFNPKSKLIAVSNAVRENILNTLPELDPGRCLVIHNAIDSKELESHRLSRAQARKALQIDDSDFLFGTVGRLIPFKAHSLLIDAFASVSHLMPDSRLVIIGGGELYEKLKRQIIRLGLEERIKLAGFVAKAANHMTAFDVFVLPSENEPFGLVLLEAMFNHVPIIGADSGGVPEILPDRKSLFASGKLAALADRLLSYYRMSVKERGQLAEAGFCHMQTHFSVEKFHRAYRQLGGG